MTSTFVKIPSSSIFLSEVFPIEISQPNLARFKLTPTIKKKDGNRLSFHFSLNLPRMVVIWDDGYFYALGLPNRQMPSQQEWQEILEDVQQTIKDYRDRYYSLQLDFPAQTNPLIFAKLAFQILRKTKFDSLHAIPPNKNIAVKRELIFSEEVIEVNGILQPGLTLSVNSSILYQGTLEKVYQNYTNQDNYQTFFQGLRVRDMQSRSYGTIVDFPGTVGQHRERLIEQATRKFSKDALQKAPDDQPLVTVEFRDLEQRDYPLVILQPSITAETSERFKVEYGKLLKATKIPHKKRTELLKKYKEEVKKFLKNYGIQLKDSLNSSQHPNLFWQPSFSLEQISLLFGNNIKGVRGEVLSGLSRGGVFRRYPEYTDPSRVIRIAALQMCDLNVDDFLEQVKQRLKLYKFESELVTQKIVLVDSLKESDARATIDRTVDELLAIPHDIFLVFLPQSDRRTDEEKGGSLYHRIYSRLLRRQMASQNIYADTLSSVNYRQILNQIIPGILAKLGNLPFILAEPLEIADYILGLDVSREAKKKLPGSKNICASVRLYGKQGEFISYQLEDGSIPGEEIPYEWLENLLQESKFKSKTVLIYRDGLFRGGEAKNLKEWGESIGAKFILVECIKSGVPRLYELNEGVGKAPEKGLGLLCSSHEAVLVTTKVSEKIGLSRPLRLRIHEESHPVSIESVLETTLKLTLLHHGALQTPRLPMPIYGADRIAYLRLRNIYPSSALSGDRQFWL